MRALLTWISVLAIVLGVSLPAHAQGLSTGPGDSADNPLGSPPGSRWRNSSDRFFIASRLDAGFFFLRPRISAGWGKPHYQWFGLDAVPILSTSALGGYMGGRIERGLFELRTGALYQFSFNRSYLTAKDSYSRRDIDIIEGPRAQYWLWDSQLELYLPLGRLKLHLETQPIVAFGFPEDKNLYLDTMWVVIGSGLTLRQRVGVEFFLRGTNIGLSPTIELVWLDERQVAIIRAGVHLRWLLSDEFQVRTSILPVVNSPDFLGRAGGDVLELSMRWLWATD